MKTKINKLKRSRSREGKWLRFSGILLLCANVSFSDELEPIPPGILDPIIAPEKSPPRLEMRRPGSGPQPGLRRQQAAEQRAQIIERHRTQAQAHDQAGRWRMALSEYQALMRLQPHDPSHVLRAALLSTMLGQHANAEPYFARLKDMIGAMPPRPAIAWVDTLLHLGETEQAESILQDALLQRPQDVRGRFYQTILDIMNERQPETAFWLARTLPDQIRAAGWILTDQSSLRRWIGIEGMRELVRITLGEIRWSDLQAVYDQMRDAQAELQREDWATALQHLTAAQAQGADRPYLQLEIARSLMSMEKYDDASRIVLRVIATREFQPELAYPAAYILIGAQSYPDAVELIQAFFTLDQDEEMRMQMALAYALAGSGDLDAAWPIVQEMATRFPEDFPGWMSRENPHIRAIRADPRFEEFGIR